MRQSRLIPVLSPIGSEEKEHTFIDDWWRLEIGGREKERIEEGKPIFPSAATPNVTSQAYYLPSPSPDGKTSFDDCKKDNTPTVLDIPNLKAGDMFEMKASGWSGPLSSSNTRGYQAFEKQVKSQSDAVLAEGRGRQIYYCMGNQGAANLAGKAFARYPGTRFLVCH